MMRSSAADVGHALGHADAQVDHLVRAQLQRRAAGDDLALGERHGLQGVHGHAQLARKRGAVGLGKGLVVVRGLGGQHHGVHQHARAPSPAGG